MDSSGKFSVNLPVDTVITLSTLKGQAHSTYKGVPASKPFPVPYKDDFVGKFVVFVCLFVCLLLVCCGKEGQKNG